MNHAIIGKPRNGKGRFAAYLIAEELANSERRILTNLAVEKLPWVTADHQPRRGLLDYLLEKHGKTFNAEERIFRVTDEAIPNFFLYRGLSRKQVEEMGDKYLQGFRLVTPEDEVLVPSEWNLHKDIQLYVADHQFHLDKRGKKVVDEHDTRLASFSRGSVNIIDEAWKFWPARGWSSTSESVNFHFAQVGKFTDDTWVVTHRVNDVDALLIDRCQDFYVCTNHGKLTFGLFRQPAMFSVAVYATKPTPSAEPQSRKVFTLDKHGLAECFDTSAGVGVSGRVMADIGSKTKGLPVWLIPAVGVLVIVAMIYGVKFGTSYLGGMLGGKKKVPVKAAAAAHNVRSTVPGGMIDDPTGLTKVRAEEITNDVFCVGWAGMPWGIGMEVTLSDGRIAHSNLGQVQDVNVPKREVTVFGRKYEVRSRPAYTSYVPPPVETYVPAPAKYRPVNEAIILPAIHGQGGFPPPSTGGLGAMTRQARGNSGGNAEPP